MDLDLLDKHSKLQLEVLSLRAKLKDDAEFYEKTYGELLARKDKWLFKYLDFRKQVIILKCRATVTKNKLKAGTCPYCKYGGEDLIDHIFEKH